MRLQQDRKVINVFKSKVDQVHDDVAEEVDAVDEVYHNAAEEVYHNAAEEVYHKTADKLYNRM